MFRCAYRGEVLDGTGSDLNGDRNKGPLHIDARPFSSPHAVGRGSFDSSCANSADRVREQI